VVSTGSVELCRCLTSSEITVSGFYAGSCYFLNCWVIFIASNIWSSRLSGISSGIFKASSSSSSFSNSRLFRSSNCGVVAILFVISYTVMTGTNFELLRSTLLFTTAAGGSTLGFSYTAIFSAWGAFFLFSSVLEVADSVSLSTPLARCHSLIKYLLVVSLLVNPENTSSSFSLFPSSILLYLIRIFDVSLLEISRISNQGILSLVWNPNVDL